MKKFYSIFFSFIFFTIACNAQDLVSTNLNDSQSTPIQYQTGTNININSLEERSIAVDQLTLRTLHLTWRNPRRLRVPQIRNISLDQSSLYQLNYSSNNIWLADLRPMPSALDRQQFNEKALKKSKKHEQRFLLDIMPEKKLTNFISSIKYEIKEITVDDSVFKVYWSAETYNELDNMRKSYQYSQTYGGQMSPRMRDLISLMSNLDRNSYYSWINLLLQHKQSNIQRITSNASYKIIGEAWICNSNYTAEVKQQFIRNLQWVKSNGYNTVLVRFDCTEKLDDVLDLIQTIRNANMNVFMTYVGQDCTNPKWSPFIKISKFEPFFKAIAYQSNGMLLNWRSTSMHVRFLPAEYFNYICSLARQSNPTILLYGEIYFGISDASNSRRRSLYYNIPNNMTGVVIQNMGFGNYNYEYIINTAFNKIIPDYERLDKIFQVIGISPYYRSKQHAENSFIPMTIEEEYEAKHAIERQLKSCGVKTLTLLHDGVDDNYTCIVADPNDLKHWNDTTDNLLYDTTLTK